jgi:mono/diheme cytochrome c family protein
VEKVVRPQQIPTGTLNIPQCGQLNTTFKNQCASCHGAEGKGNESAHTPNFTDAQWQSSKTDKELIEVLTNGSDHGMPAFSGTLSTQETEQMIRCMVRGFAPLPQGR